MKITIEQLEHYLMDDHTLDSVIKMLHRKKEAFSSGTHWFIIDAERRNVCEFCGLQYYFANESKCMGNRV